MKNLITTLLTITLVTFSATSFSQIEIDEDSQKEKKPYFEHKRNSKHALGLAAGATTGFGLAYQYIPSKLSFQIAFTPYKDQSSSLYSVGLTFIYRVKEGEKMNFILYQGNHLLAESRTRTYVNQFGRTVNETIRDNRFNNGVGLGFEFLVSKSVTFNLMGGYAGYNNFERITLTGEGGIFYKF